MQKKNLMIISEDTKFINDKYSLSSLFEITSQSTPPSLRKIVLSRDTVFLYDIPKKKQYSFKYKITKLLGKRYSKFHNIENFFSISPHATQMIFIGHDASICNIYAYHYNWKHSSDALLYVIGIMDTIHKDESAKYEKFTAQLFEKQKVSPCLDFTGKILITNRVNSVFIRTIIKKFPNASEIKIQLVDYMNGKEVDESNHYLYNLSQIKHLPRVNISSYSRSDASAFSINYRPNAANFEKLRNLIKDPTKVYDVFFAGNGSGIRFKKIRNFIISLDKSDLSYRFILSHLNTQQRDEITDLMKSGKGEISFASVSYEELLRLSSKSVAILDLYRISPDEGFSYRIAEAFGLQCKIISDRLGLLKEKFYSENNILINENLYFSKETLRDFIHGAPCQYEEQDVQSFNLNHINKSFIDM